MSCQSAVAPKPSRYSSCPLASDSGGIPEGDMPKQYKLPYTLRAPSEETEEMYLAEVPLLPGCRAWGATADEALFNLEGVASRFHCVLHRRPRR